ncbi:Protein bir1 [Lachnellula subtilissima]|uniref:Protein bir1 n=1 Tax=Lachnellula subtilissima TaxID=602034 RepID=A0A8H8RQ64_9HELO|nr:Protein bir1 [Lachnellula subtilissima]
MGISDVADQYFAYENRVASFQTTQQLTKRRTSNTSAKAPKSLKWPHKFLSPEELAKAGFFYYPLQNSLDNVACFLCHKSLDGWEKHDDPLVEHFKHSPECGWAVVAMIERQDGVLSEESPASRRMIEARKATFADKWPHESKKGWKCKTKQMVDAGWKYTPTPEYDDMATCTYCELALDGWENSDKPLDEHFSRSPECAFFTLINQVKSPAVKRTKPKRASKVSRLSTQSQFTVASDALSMTDLPAEEGDSILTTATNATATQGGRKMGKAKKAPVKGKKTRTKKTEPVEVEAAPESEPEDAVADAKADAAPKPTRGRKRKSEEDHDSTMSAVEDAPPPPKRRNTRTQQSMAVDDSVMQNTENVSQQQEVPHKGRKGRATRGSTAMDDSVLSVAESVSREQEVPQKGRRGRPSRKASTASVAPTRAPIPNDDEIDAALEADLERMSDEEIPMPPKKTTRASKAGHAMFNTESMEIDEAVIDAELEAMEIDSKPLPKAKGAKAKQPRKVSAKQQAAAKKAAEAQAQAQAEVEAAAAVIEEEAERSAEEEAAAQQIAVELEQSMSIQHSSPVLQPKKQRAVSRQPARKPVGRATRGSTLSTNDQDTSMANSVHESATGHADDSGHETDASMASQSTVVRGDTRRGSTMKGRGKGGKKGAKHIEEIVHQHVEHSLAVETEEENFYTPAPEASPIIEEPVEDVTKKAAKPRGRPKKSQTPVPQDSVLEMEDVPEPMQPKTKQAKGKAPAPVSRSPTPPAREMTPSESPQSSDAENQPPSSKPSAATKKTVTPHSTKRIPLAETTTPSMSPSKRNIIAGLQTLHPWSSADLDTVFMKSPNGGNVVMNTKALFGEEMKTGALASPEKKMSVEEWIHYNAEQAEERLRNECERMVSSFEQQGTRAMRALEGIECLE